MSGVYPELVEGGAIYKNIILKNCALDQKNTSISRISYNNNISLSIRPFVRQKAHKLDPFDRNHYT
jgi:hypothetical protein